MLLTAITLVAISTFGQTQESPEVNSKLIYTAWAKAHGEAYAAAEKVPKTRRAAFYNGRAAKAAEQIQKSHSLNSQQLLRIIMEGVENNWLTDSSFESIAAERFYNDYVSQFHNSPSSIVHAGNFIPQVGDIVLINGGSEKNDAIYTKSLKDLKNVQIFINSHMFANASEITRGNRLKAGTQGKVLIAGKLHTSEEK